MGRRKKRTSSVGKLQGWRACALTFSTAILISTPTFAHLTFLWSEEQIWKKGAIVRIAMTSALKFPEIEFPLSRDRVAFASVTVGNSKVDDISYEETETALNLSFQPENAGFAMVALSTHPRSGAISPEDVAEYFDEIDADASVREAFDALPGSPAMMRSYAKHAKAFLCVAICESGREAAAEPVGQALELVAVDWGTRSFAVVRNGERVARHRVAIYGADGSQSKTVADANGEFQLDASLSGAVLLSAIWLTVPEQPDGVYHSD